MPSPVFAFAFIVATLYGLGFHFVVGGPARRLALFVVSSWVGFLLGQHLGDLLDIAFLNSLRLGIVHLLPASFCSAAFLLFARRLTLESDDSVTRR